MKIKKGIDYYVCTECGGLGYRKRGMFEFREFPYSENIMCPFCNGKGFLLAPETMAKIRANLKVRQEDET